MSCRAASWLGNGAGYPSHCLCLGLCCSPKLAHRKSPGECEGAKIGSVDTAAVQPGSSGRQGMLVYAGAWPGSVWYPLFKKSRVPSGAVTSCGSSGFQMGQQDHLMGFRDVLTATQVQCGHVVGALQIRLGGANCLHQSLEHRAAQARFPWGSTG